MSSIKKIDKMVKEINPLFNASLYRNCVKLEGETENYDEIIKAGKLAVTKDRLGVLNDIKLKGFIDKISSPSISDCSLDNLKVDCLIIGGGVTGCAILRELSKYDINLLLIEKESDISMHQSSKNGGVVHVGIDMTKHPIKASYCVRGNNMYDKLTQELEVPFEHFGQVVLLKDSYEKIVYPIMKRWAKKLNIPKIKYMNRNELLKIESEIPRWCTGGIYMPTGGIVNPFKLTVAMAENAIQNGAKISLETMAYKMDVEDGVIKAVYTNRGKIIPKVVINAAGIHADTISEMAQDRTFTIHPRKGTDVILDKKVGYLVKTSYSKSPLTIVKSPDDVTHSSFIKGISNFIKYNKKHVTKGLGSIHSIDGNMLVGPTAIETPYTEDYTTDEKSFNFIIEQARLNSPKVKRSDTIAYFSGTRAATYEEDFVVRKGIFTKNIMEACGIQSPGLTAAPAIALDISLWTVEYLNSLGMNVALNKTYNPHHKSVKSLKDYPVSLRDKMIKANPKYGEIVCRCEQISLGEIEDCLSSPLPVYTMDAIKRRVRPGMGRCQGSFCSPHVLEILANKKKVKLEDINKSNRGSVILFSDIKGGKDCE